MCISMGVEAHRIAEEFAADVTDELALLMKFLMFPQVAFIAA